VCVVQIKGKTLWPEIRAGAFQEKPLEVEIGVGKTAGYDAHQKIVEQVFAHARVSWGYARDSVVEKVILPLDQTLSEMFPKGG
jgi:hypothetical protein